MADRSRPHDIVLFGATGFTGGLTAEELARAAPEDTRWALAGRNRSKLEAVRERVRAIAPDADLDLFEADVTDAASLRRVAESATVVATTVGPYHHHGEPLVAACAAAGTDYLDITGEPEFVDRVYLQHHDTAVASGARLVHCCGFDSIPHDLGVLFTVGHLPAGAPLAIRGYVRAGGRFSAGTFASAVTAMGRLRQSAAVAGERRQAEPELVGRTVRSLPEVPHRVDSTGAWALPMPTIDPQIVRRSAAALDRYGPDFAYGHFLTVKHLPVALGLAGGVGALVGLAQVPLARRLLLGRVQSGDGPSAEEREEGWFQVRFEGEGGGRRVTTEVTGGDPGYGDTSKMLAQSALCLAHDDLPATAGQTTTAAAMGQALVDRLQQQGIGFKVLESTSTST